MNEFACVSHVELRICGADIVVIEVNLRPAGGRLPELISTVTGWDLHEVAVAIALGREIPAPAPVTCSVGKYHCLTVEKPSHVFYEKADIAIVSDAPPPPVEIDVPSGELVYPVNDPQGGIFGRILAFGATDDEASSVIGQVLGNLALRLEPAAPPNRAASKTSGCWNKGCC